MTHAAVAHCRAGFEPEAATDLLRLAAGIGAGCDIDAPAGRGFVVARLDRFDPRSWPRAIERAPPIFVRSLFVGTGPHRLIEAAAGPTRPDRVAPLTALLEHFLAALPLAELLPRAHGHTNGISLRLETADTNDGKAVSGLARALDARLARALQERGLISVGDTRSDASAAAHLHVLFPDGAHAYVGASVAPWASAWAMGIPRLRVPRGAPSRSARKLAEAIPTFLGKRERDVLRPGMCAVDLGAAPGGWTWQLARRGLRVTAVDNGPLKGGILHDPLVVHLRADGLSWLPKRPVDWMVCDIVDQPAKIAALVARWIGHGHAQYAIFNLKLPMKKRYDEVRRCEAIVRDTLAKARVRHTLALRHLYHDREEVTGFLEQAG